MIVKKLALLFTIASLSIIAAAQTKDRFKVQLSDCEDNTFGLQITYPKLITPLKGAEQYIASITGEKLLSKFHFSCYGSSEMEYSVYSKNIKELRAATLDTCYALDFWIIDKADTIGYLSLLMDKKGRPLKSEDFHDRVNRPELISGYKKHFGNKFKISYAQAIAIAKAKGILGKPVLECETTNKTYTAKNGEVFIKVKYYWSFSYWWDGGHSAKLDINAETGEIEKEEYNPRMPG